jgi:hypothetical protein
MVKGWCCGVVLVLALCGCGGGGGGAQPVAGGYQTPGEDQTYKLVLVVFEEGGDRVDHVGLYCAPEGTIAGLPVTVGRNLDLDGGKFTTKAPDVEIAGEFVSERRAEGTIRALTANARECGVPEQGSWTADCNLEVERTSGGGFSVSTAKQGPCAPGAAE